ncbi:ACP6 [Symbiodinium sp. CCMP2456]|nr:ACP6 [Symbiodinium sp. CCMP2456]
MDVTTLVMEECKVDSFSRNAAEIVERLKGIEERCDFAGREVGALAETRGKLERLPLFSAPAGVMYGKFSWLHGYDVLTCYAAHPELTPPSSVAAIAAHGPAAASQVLWRFSQYYEDPQILRLTAGDLLLHMSEQMERCRAVPAALETAGPRLTVYSGHDTTLMPLLKALGIWDGAWPGYAAEVRLELWQLPEGSRHEFAVRAVIGSRVLPLLPGKSEDGDGLSLCCSLAAFHLCANEVASGVGTVHPVLKLS